MRQRAWLLLLRRRLPCEEEPISDELQVVAGVHPAGFPQHRHGGRVAAFQFITADPIVVVPPSRADERVVAAGGVHEPISAHRLRRRRRLGAVVEDEVLVERAVGEREAEFGGGVGRGDMAPFFTGTVEGVELVGVGDEQGEVAVEDAEDAEPVLAAVVPEVRDVAGAVDLEPHQAALVLLRPVHEPERGRHDQVAASLGYARRRRQQQWCRDPGDDDDEEEEVQEEQGAGHRNMYEIKEERVGSDWLTTIAVSEEQRRRI